MQLRYKTWSPSLSVNFSFEVYYPMSQFSCILFIVVTQIGYVATRHSFAISSDLHELLVSSSNGLKPSVGGMFGSLQCIKMDNKFERCCDGTLLLHSSSATARCKELCPSDLIIRSSYMTNQKELPKLISVKSSGQFPYGCERMGHSASAAVNRCKLQSLMKTYAYKLPIHKCSSAKTQLQDVRNTTCHTWYSTEKLFIDWIYLMCYVKI